MGSTKPAGVGLPKLLRWLLFVAGLLVVAGLLGAVVLTAWKASVDRRLDAVWRRSLGGAELAAFLDSARPTLDSVRTRLAQGPPVWKRDLSAGFESKITNYLGVLMLQKLLLLDAREQLRAGRAAPSGAAFTPYGSRGLQYHL